MSYAEPGKEMVALIEEFSPPKRFVDNIIVAMANMIDPDVKGSNNIPFPECRLGDIVDFVRKHEALFTLADEIDFVFKTVKGEIVRESPNTRLAPGAEKFIGCCRKHKSESWVPFFMFDGAMYKFIDCYHYSNQSKVYKYHNEFNNYLIVPHSKLEHTGLNEEKPAAYYMHWGSSSVVGHACVFQSWYDLIDPDSIEAIYQIAYSLNFPGNFPRCDIGISEEIKTRYEKYHKRQ